MTPEQNIQVAPYPHELADLVERCRYRAHEGWQVNLIDDCPRDKDPAGNVIGHGLTLAVLTKGYNTYQPENGPSYRVYHYFIVPSATYNRASWQRWLFDQLCQVELHEAMENFVIEGEPDEPGGPAPLYRPLAPLHGPGESPYVVHEYATDVQRRTRFTGEVLPS